MSQKDKLIRKLKSRPKDFTYDEAETLLQYLTFRKDNKGKTSGSRVMFVSEKYGTILLHEPHPPQRTARISDQTAVYKIGTGGIDMINTMEYKGYTGSVEFSEEDGILFGKVQGIRSLISYEGTTVSELIADFHGAVDDYLSFCISENKEPEKSFKGSFNVRFRDPLLHKRAAVYAFRHHTSLNHVIEEAVKQFLMHVDELTLPGEG